eukprot:scaffold218621_cov19-Tisochrysis_lutea.AAC.1
MHLVDGQATYIPHAARPKKYNMEKRKDCTVQGDVLKAGSKLACNSQGYIRLAIKTTRPIQESLTSAQTATPSTTLLSWLRRPTQSTPVSMSDHHDCKLFTLVDKSMPAGAGEVDRFKHPLHSHLGQQEENYQNSVPFAGAQIVSELCHNVITVGHITWCTK